MGKVARGVGGGGGGGGGSSCTLVAASGSLTVHVRTTRATGQPEGKEIRKHYLPDSRRHRAAGDGNCVSAVTAAKQFRVLPAPSNGILRQVLQVPLYAIQIGIHHGDLAIDYNRHQSTAIRSQEVSTSGGRGSSQQAATGSRQWP